MSFSALLCMATVYSIQHLHAPREPFEVQCNQARKVELRLHDSWLEPEKSFLQIPIFSLPRKTPVYTTEFFYISMEHNWVKILGILILTTKFLILPKQLFNFFGTMFRGLYQCTDSLSQVLLFLKKLFDLISSW